jgi:hypothetical protein
LPPPSGDCWSESLRARPLPWTEEDRRRVGGLAGGAIRVHLDIWSIDRSQEDEVAWLLGRGAAGVDIGQGQVPWVVLADPEGNEFCVLG